MNRVYQTKFGDEDGNCLAACVASLLEIPIERVPIIAVASRQAWHTELQDLLGTMGLVFLELDLTKPVSLCKLPNTLCILTIPTHFDCNHAVIARTDFNRGKCAFTLVHDPHPEGIPASGEPIAVAFLVPLDPSEIL